MIDVPRSVEDEFVKGMILPPLASPLARPGSTTPPGDWMGILALAAGHPVGNPAGVNL